MSIKYLPVPITERIPQQLDIGADMTQHSVVVSRATRSYLPSSGQVFSYTGSNIIELVISDTNYLDLQTIGLHYNAKITGTGEAGGAQFTCLENGYAPFYKFELLINGVLVSTCTDLPQVVGQVIAATCSREYYESALSRSGFWLDSNAMRLTGADGLCSSLEQKALIVGTEQQSAGGMNVFVDLMPLIRMFSETNSYFPARNVSNITLRLYLQPDQQQLTNFVNADYTGGNHTASNPASIVTLSQVKLNVDSVVLSPTFTSAFDQFVERSSADPQGGLNLLFSDIVSQRSIIPAGNQTDILLSKTCKYLKSIFGSIHRTADLSSSAFIKSERQKICNNNGFQVNIGGVLYPMDRPTSRQQVMYENDKAWNKSYDVLAGTLQNLTNSVGLTSYVGSVPVAGNFDDNDAGITYTTWQQDPDSRAGFCNHYVMGVNLEQVLQHGGQTLNGVSLSGGAPAIVRMFFDAGTAIGADHSAIFVMYFNKVVKVRYNQVEVLE